MTRAWCVQGLAPCFVLFLAVGCAEEVNRVQLVPAMDTTAFSCVDRDTGMPVVTRALQPGVEAISIAVDFIRVPTFPSCRPRFLLAACEGGGCPVAQRSCIEVPLDAIDRSSAEAAAESLVGALGSAGPLTGDAPDGVVLVRGVATVEGCDGLEVAGGAVPAYDPSQLLGCMYSCPVQLDEVPGEVLLDLDVLGDCSEQELVICAQL